MQNLNNDARLEPKRSPDPFQIDKMDNKKCRLEAKRRQKRSQIEKRIQAASGRLGPGTFELLLGAFCGTLFHQKS